MTREQSSDVRKAAEIAAAIHNILGQRFGKKWGAICGPRTQQLIMDTIAPLLTGNPSPTGAAAEVREAISFLRGSLVVDGKWLWLSPNYRVKCPELCSAIETVCAAAERALAAQKEAPEQKDYQTIADNLLGSPLRENREWLAGWLRNFDKGNFQLKEAPDARHPEQADIDHFANGVQIERERISGAILRITASLRHDPDLADRCLRCKLEAALRPASQTEEAGK